MRNYQNICYRCFSDKTTPGPCPICGYDPAAAPNPSNALPNGSILNGRYLSGCVLSSPSNEFVYSCFDMTLENKLLLHEYAPQGCLRDPADRCSIAFSDSATRYDFQESARAHMERAKALLRVKDHPDQPALTDYFEENNSSYYVTEYREITPEKSAVRPSAPASSQATVMPETTANAAAPASLQHVDYQAGGYGQTSQQSPQGTQTKKFIIAALIAAAALCVIIPLVLHSKKADRRSADTSTVVDSTTPELTGEATPEPTEAVTPDVTESATPEPGETPAPESRFTGSNHYQSSTLCYEIDYPDGFAVSAGENGLDTFTYGEEVRLIINYNAFSDIPLYGPEDVMRDPEKVLAYNLEGVDGVQYVDANLADDGSYAQILFKVDSDQIYDGFSVYFPCDNEPGCYVFTTIYPENDQEARNAVSGIVNSFKQTADLPHGYELLGDESVGLRVFVPEDSHAGDVYTSEVENSYDMLTLSVSVNGDGTVSVERFDDNALTPDTYVDNLKEALLSQGFEVVTEKYTADRGNYHYVCIDMVQQAGDQSDIVTFASCEEENSIVAITAEQVVHEDQRMISDSVSTVFGYFLDTLQIVR